MLHEETLFIALTRPALKWGVPVEAFYLNFSVAFLAGVELQAPGWRCPIVFWLLALPIHVIFRELTGWDPLWCHTLKLCFLTLTIHVLEALPRLPLRHPDEIQTSV